MILDNENENPKVYEWIDQNTHTGNLDLVTGYFTIGALAYLSDKTNEKIKRYRFIIGDIVSDSDQKIKSINLLNENLSIQSAFNLKNWAMLACDFLRQNKIECKTLEPNFCHAKLFITETANKNPVQATYIMGSSNLTEAGIGLRKNQNIELNTSGTGTESIYRELKHWFEELWNKPQAHLDKTIMNASGKLIKVNFKQYLIDEISKIFAIYTPLDIYHKVLYSLFYQEDENEFSKDVSKLETSQIYEKLYTFQKLGVINLIKILNKFDGAILADAVGLGKTWSTLAIIKFFQIKGRETILLCPKKLEHNWKQYLKRQNSIFEEDKFDYLIHFHTDFSENNLENNKINLEYLTNDRPKLFVIDESHNLRNDKSIRYQILMEEILKKTSGDIKVLLLSATPINNNFKDVRNQFALMVRGNNGGYQESLDIKNIEYVFRNVQKSFNQWNKNSSENLTDFYRKIQDSDFFKLTESLVVARTRKNIKTYFDATIHFPKVLKPINIFKTPLKIGDFEDLADMMDKLNLNLSAYQPSQFTLTIEEIKARKNEKLEKKGKSAKDAVLKDELNREFFLAKMMKILMLKRLESSWFAFKNTVENIYNHHENALNKIKKYKDGLSKLEEIEKGLNSEEDDEALQDLIDSYQVGKKNPIKLSQIESAGRLEDFKNAIRKDKENLLILKTNLESFEREYNTDYKTDIKLVELFKIVEIKQKEKNKKLIVFTAYKDTALYLYNFLKSKKFNPGLVYGDKGLINDVNIDIQSVLQHFAPYTKLFLEKKWNHFYHEKNMNSYHDWKLYISKSEPSFAKILHNEIDILITTDVLSEGQNLQDADLVINYDVHWNPVRVIQRFGRIDRIGSPNEQIQCINFWPTDSIDGYINLKKRVEARMAVMQFIGSEVIETFTEEFEHISDNPLEQRQTDNLLKQLDHRIEDLDSDQSLGFDDFSFDNFKQQLSDVLKGYNRYIENMPQGVFSGCELLSPDLPSGIIALLGMKPFKESKYIHHYLIYIDDMGQVYSDNMKEVLEVLNQHKNQIRIVPDNIDTGDQNALEKLQNLLYTWIDGQIYQEDIDRDGVVKVKMGKATLDLISKIKSGSKSTLHQINDGFQLDKRFGRDNFDLITWLKVSNV